MGRNKYRGEALSSLRIVRLLFPVPDPVIDYKKSVSKDPLMDIDVPEMLIKLRQGTGRLSRNYEDKGLITILDPRVGRIYNRSYLDSIWNSLPMKVKTNDINDVKEFINKNLNIE